MWACHAGLRLSRDSVTARDKQLLRTYSAYCSLYKAGLTQFRANRLAVTELFIVSSYFTLCHL